MNNKDLCIKLISCETESEVISVLKKAGYWNNDRDWMFYGGIENNFSIIGNQQSTAESALVEKLVNSIDAVLISESLKRGIHPESPAAPQSVRQAVQDFFHVHEGSLNSIDAGQRNLLAEKIKLVATGYKTKPTLTIIDEGEGQYPEDFHDTFLSLAKSNKIKIPFVQGKFNMGGSGVLQFCGEHNLQLIVSKKNTLLGDSDWGVTIVRRQEPKAGYKSSAYTYLAPGGKILTFKADSLPVAPGAYPNAYGEPMESGTLIKLYEYSLAGGLKTNIKFDLYYKLNQLLPQLALPIRLYERRKGYKGETMQTTLNGLNIRLTEDRGKNIEEGFPSSFSFRNLKVELYAFKNPTHYVNQDGVLFTVNGQTQGTLSSQFYNRKNVGMGSLADSLLMIVNCDGLSAVEREDLFMNSRDRLRSGKVRSQIERELENYVANHTGLKELRRRKRHEKIEQETSETFREALQKIIGQSKILSSLFHGETLDNPYRQLAKAKAEKFEGRKFPTYFNLRQEGRKKAHLGSRFRVQYITDAVNDYLTRESEPGDFRLYVGRERIDCAINMWNGYVNVNINLPTSQPGDILQFRSELYDNSRPEPFVDHFEVEVMAPKRKTRGKAGERKPPISDEKGQHELFKGKVGMPNIIEVHKQSWGQYGFGKYDCLKIINNGEMGYDFAINVDNRYLLSELLVTEGVSELKMKYQYVVALLGMALLHSNMEEQAGEITRAISPVIIPIINLQ